VEAKPAPDEVVWWSGLRWVDAARMQMWRFEEAFAEVNAALADAYHRHQLSDDSGVRRSWREHYDTNYEPYDPQRPLRVPAVGLHMQVANELDLLIVAVRNVLRAQERIPEWQRPSMGDQDVLELLRNVAEHWDEVGGRSAETLASDHPAIDVGGIASTNKETWIGGGEGVPLSRIQAWLGRVRTALVACLTDAGVDVPEDHRASQVEGDDDLPWPAERLYFHWSIARVEAQEWPREPMPDDLAQALAMLFASRRARDHTD
jgi:hypothetical protein